MTTLSEGERRAILKVCEYAAIHCGGGEDVLGAFLYTGAFHELERPNSEIGVADLVRKLEGKGKDGILVHYTFTALYREAAIIFERAAYLPAIPAVGTIVTFPQEEGESVVKAVHLHEDRYTIVLDTIQFDKYEYRDTRELIDYFLPRGWCRI